MAQLPISAGQVSTPNRRDGLRDLFQLFYLVRHGPSTVRIGTVFANVPRRVFLCLVVVARPPVAQIPFRQFPRSSGNSRVTIRLF